MRLLFQFALRTRRTLALLLLALTLSDPVRSQTATPEDTIRIIAQQQKVISETYKLERAGQGVIHMKTLALLAAYGGWTRYHNTDGAVRLENLNLKETAQRFELELVYAKKAVEKNESVSEEELRRFANIILSVEALLVAASDMHALLEGGKIDEANALYRDSSIPLIDAITAGSYTLISSLQDKIEKTALHVRLAK